ncbi:glutamine-hydrolyzing GMP synthase [Candidatus Pacearchaeota archaeon]|nr:glutamine-hydrolyzing GMP synthase [Candidatus Pacearchaeota archaeon]
MGIAILDFGSQYSHLILRRIRELGVFSQIFPYDVDINIIKKLNPEGIILSGGPASIYEKTALQCDKKLFSLGKPILGICYGHQLITKELGGKVERSDKKEYGKKILEIKDKKDLFKGLADQEIIWMSHGDKIIKSPKGFEVLGSTKECKISAFRNSEKKIYGVQFHPEVSHTSKGTTILKNFIFRICNCRKEWTIKNVKKELINKIKKEVGNEGVLIGVSGGIDSLVAATLLNKIIGDKLYCIFIDNGLLRQNEKREVISSYKKLGFKNFNFVNAREEFLNKLKGVTDPERKRKIIGHTFIKMFEKITRDLEKREKIKFLAQGTIYPDRVESAKTSKSASKIKSHHNLTLPKKMKFQIIEPLKELYKDEVKRLGNELQVPKEWVSRHPFPGPGLAIRILGGITEERIKILREVDSIFIEELRKNKLYEKIWQAFAALLPVKAVGVMGDNRTYNYIISLRAVLSRDGMTADWAKIPLHVLEKISNRILNEVKGVNRVLYDISQKPPATIEYE